MKVVVLPQPNKRKIVPTVGLEPTITDIWAIISSVIQLTDVCRVPAILYCSTVAGCIYPTRMSRISHLQGAECEAVVRGASRSPRQRVKTHFLPTTLVQKVLKQPFLGLCKNQLITDMKISVIGSVRFSSVNRL